MCANISESPNPLRFFYSIAQIIWSLLIRMCQIICTIISDTTPHHWWPMLNCPFNSHPNFTQLCLIQTLTQITLHWQPMLNCPFNSNPDFVQSCLILFSPILLIYVKIFTSTLLHDATMNFLLDQSSFCEAIDCPNFGLPMGFKARVVLSLTLFLASSPTLYIANGSSESTLMRLGPNHEPLTCWVDMWNVSNLSAMPACFAQIIRMIFPCICRVN